MSNPGDFIIENGVLKKYKGPGGEVVIPEGVTSIDYGAFMRCSSLTSVIIPESVTSIGKSAFYNCRSLTSVTIPEGVTSIGDSAFEDCYNLNAVYISDLAAWCKIAFSYYSSNPLRYAHKLFLNGELITDLVIPDTVTCISDRAFSGCSGLTSVTIPEGVTEIGGSAFSGCSGLISVVIPESLTTIGSSAFSGCTGLTGITIPNSVTDIGESAFKDCSGLTGVTIPESVTSISALAFFKCSRLTSVTIPEGVTNIGNSAFEGCSSLTSVIIPESVTSIDYGAFMRCSSLTSVTIPESVTTIGWRALMDCSSLCSLVWNCDKVKIDQDLFGDAFPAGLIPEIRFLYHPMTVVAVTQYILHKEIWDALEPDLQYKIYTEKQGKSVVSALQKCMDPEQAEYIGSCLLRDLDPKGSAGSYTMTATFMTAFGRLISADLLRNLYNALKSMKKAEKAVRIIEADKTVMSLIQSEDDSNKLSPVEQAVVRYERESAVSSEALLKDFYALKLSDLPVLLDKDGKELDPNVTAYLLTACEKQGITANVDYMWSVKDQLKDAPTTEEAKALVQQLDIHSLQAAWMHLADQYLTGAGRSKKMFLVFPICRFADESTMQELTKRAAKWKSDPFTCFTRAVVFSDTKAAIFFADRFRVLDLYADFRGTDADTIRDTVMTDTGLDENGQKTYDLGSKTVRATLREDLTIELFDIEKNKVIRSLSKKDTDPQLYEAAKRDISALRTNVRKVTKKRTDMLLEQFLSGKEIAGASWDKLYRGNPVIRMLGKLLVWEQEGVSFAVTDAGIVNCRGEEYRLTERPIRVAHPIEMDPEEVAAWQKSFISRGLKQPFEQIWEPVYSAESIKADRYEGSRIKYKYLKDRDKHGISAHIQKDYYDSATKLSLKECRIDFSIPEYYYEVSMDLEFALGKFSFTRLTRQVNHIVYLLDKLTLFDRIEKDDQTIQLLLPGFTLAQITEFIKTAQEAGAANVLALLLEYKNTHFADFDPMDEFTLEW